MNDEIESIVKKTKQSLFLEKLKYISLSNSTHYDLRQLAGLNEFQLSR